MKARVELNYLRMESSFSSCAHVNERSGFINGEVFLDELSENQLLKKLYDNNNARF
jgi:hypothetical protein